MKISYLGAATGLLAAFLQACTVYEPYPKTPSQTTAGISTIPFQERFNMINGVSLRVASPVDEPDLYSKGTLPPDSEPFVYLHDYEYLVIKELDYWQQVKMIKRLAQNQGADAIVGFEVKEAVPPGALYPLSDSKLLVGSGIKYLRI